MGQIDDHAKKQLDNIAAKINTLVAECEQLKKQNLSLQEEHDALISEKAKLIEKSELARQKVEAMITRLKSMESS